MTHRTSLSIGLAACCLALTAAAAPAHFASLVGPPWISIEYPANPHDSSTRGAFLLVHAFHHGTPVGFPVTGTAEGIVDGARRSVSLEFDRTSRPGVYALKRQWGTAGLWTLVISVNQQKDDVAQAMVEISSSGEVTSVRVPTRQQGQWNIPRAITAQEIEQSLKRRAGE